LVPYIVRFVLSGAEAGETLVKVGAGLVSGGGGGGSTAAVMTWLDDDPNGVVTVTDPEDAFVVYIEKVNDLPSAATVMALSPLARVEVKLVEPETKLAPVIVKPTHLEV